MLISKHALYRLKDRFSLSSKNEINDILSILSNPRACINLTNKKGGLHLKFKYRGVYMVAVIKNGVIITFKYRDKVYMENRKEQNMNKKVSGEKVMTVKEIAEVLTVDERTIQRYVRKLTTELSGVKNSQGGYLLNQKDVTLIKLTMQKNQHLDNVAMLPKTDLEKEMLIQQAIQYQQEKIKELTIKAQVADELAETYGLYLPTTVGKIVMGKPNTFCQWLVDSNIMYRKGKHNILVPKSPFDRKEKDYFKIKVSTYKNSSGPQTYFTPRGLCWIQARYFKQNGLLMLDCSQGSVE